MSLLDELSLMRYFYSGYKYNTPGIRQFRGEFAGHTRTVLVLWIFQILSCILSCSVPSSSSCGCGVVDVGGSTYMGGFGIMPLHRSTTIKASSKEMVRCLCCQPATVTMQARSLPVLWALPL
jgi:hypothetical protein